MSFICDRCKKPQPAKAKPHRVVIETRRKDYVARYREGVMIDVGGAGTEIVREEQLCAKCATWRTTGKFVLPA